MMKTKVLLIMSALLLIGALENGCKAISQSTRSKQVNIETELYGFKVTAFDPATGSSSPTGMFGWGKIFYRSIPVEPGQPFYASHETYSLWSDRPASKTVIWVGRSTIKSELRFEAVPETMIKVSADSIKNGETTLKVVSPE